MGSLSIFFWLMFPLVDCHKGSPKTGENPIGLFFFFFQKTGNRETLVLKTGKPDLSYPLVEDTPSSVVQHPKGCVHTVRGIHCRPYSATRTHVKMLVECQHCKKTRTHARRWRGFSSVSYNNRTMVESGVLARWLTRPRDIDQGGVAHFALSLWSWPPQVTDQALSCPGGTGLVKPLARPPRAEGTPRWALLMQPPCTARVCPVECRVRHASEPMPPLLWCGIDLHTRGHAQLSHTVACAPWWLAWGWGWGAVQPQQGKHTHEDMRLRGSLPTESDLRVGCQLCSSTPHCQHPKQMFPMLEDLVMGTCMVLIKNANTE
eukprot:TRINITY_DN2169_c0_g1_i16.p1 TRINITY_DN2169_c0_g1~~TRINITY_DN2169_c0_g1_i16.p1  ORF type:complete len:318 (-),score=-71.96 TRINITY_DN2169_c0_g1_i16:656-1609(-)